MGDVPPIDEKTIERICRKTKLALAPSCSPEDAAYQLDIFRETYRLNKTIGPKLTTAVLKREFTSLQRHIDALQRMLSQPTLSVLRDAIVASGFDLLGSREYGRTAMDEAQKVLSDLSGCVDNLRKRRTEYEALLRRDPAKAHQAFLLKGTGHRAVLPYVGHSVVDQKRPMSVERELAKAHIPAVYEFMFGRRFNPEPARDGSSTFTGPSIRFVWAVFEEMKLHDGALDRAQLSIAIGNAFNNRNKKKYA
ncbi:hypothetical protein [Rhodoplanes roseus]|uniref:hypothetical protein n=1 Tax=Rhodoplanes roseus TaxID=29409 RepID=UPI0011B69AB8|nr:hypothetical protein [Rhodoplanes roseus]